MNAGQMMKCMDMASSMSGIGGIGQMFMTPTMPQVDDQDETTSFLSGHSNLNPYSSLVNPIAQSVYGYKPPQI